MRAVSLFSGIGGIESGLAKHGIETFQFCEVDPLASAILKKRFDGAKVDSDIKNFSKLPACDVLTAGFPCQDLSQAGGKRGIKGSQSGLVKHLFDLIRAMNRASRPEWIVVENVPYMLRLGRGRAMKFLAGEFEKLGYEWAYRVVDARCFGLPQRRQRVILVASKTNDPTAVLFADDYSVPDLDGKPSSVDENACYGFYWTEGSRGVGWVHEGVPPIKVGSTVGIASPPAIWIPSEDFVGTLDIRDAERLQGFPANWTNYRSTGIEARPSLRWRLVGNAVSCRVSDWIGRRLVNPRPKQFSFSELNSKKGWPKAAFSSGKEVYEANVGPWASKRKQLKLSDFIKHDLKPLSTRATTGFLNRAELCTNVVYSEVFLDSLHRHLQASRQAVAP